MGAVQVRTRTKTNRRRSLAHDSHDHVERRHAKKVLKHPPVRFDAACRAAIAEGFARACSESAIVLHACAIGYDHVHVVSARHVKSIEQVVGQLKGRATQAMRERRCHPFQRFASSADAAPPTPWAERCWSVYINNEDQLRAAVKYVERHPVKEGLPAQTHPFVIPV